MAVFKCKMCGGDLEIDSGVSVAECTYCGAKQTIPRLDDEHRANLYDRANHFRRNNDYDKAMSLYEKILNEDPTDAEAYWSLVLCRYGIEYVVDPATGKRVPTINRTQFSSVLADEDYKSALMYADLDQCDVLAEEAHKIDEIQKNILTISQNEEPFDVFICYKETDENGRRTHDSVFAHQLYDGLKSEGFKVFFARVTLEDKLGTAYEPYIFAALNSAKAMVVIGTKPAYFNAPWVKNEWSRYLALIKKGEKKVLIPAYRDMDPYDLPEEFSHLQAQDMSKLGFMQDLIRGIKKIVAKPKKEAAAPTAFAPTAQGGNVANLLKRVSMFLEDGDFANADECCEKVLDIDAENADAYLYKLLLQLQLRKPDDLLEYCGDLSEMPSYRKAFAFGNARRQEFLSRAEETAFTNLSKKLRAEKKEFEERAERIRKENERLERERRECEERTAFVRDHTKAVESVTAELNSLNPKLREYTAKINRLNYRIDEMGGKIIRGRIGAIIHMLGAAAFWITLIFLVAMGSYYDGAAYIDTETLMVEAFFPILLFLVFPIISVGLNFMLRNRPHDEHGAAAVFWHFVLDCISFGLSGFILSMVSLFTFKGKAAAPLIADRDSALRQAKSIAEQIKSAVEKGEVLKAEVEEFQRRMEQEQSEKELLAAHGLDDDCDYDEDDEEDEEDVSDYSDEYDENGNYLG